MKRILGLDLGTASIGWALVNEAENSDEKSEITKLGVRIIQYDNFSKIDKSGKVSESKSPIDDFLAGRGLSPNASRTQKKGARRNLQRFKLRRENLIEILIKNKIILENTPLTEIGENSTYETLSLRAKSAIEKISLEEFARVLLAINKKRGYKSSRKAKNEEEGSLIDGMAIAKELYDNNLTVGQYVYNLLESGKKFIPDFYRSDLQSEFDKVWDFQKQFYAEILTDDLYNNLIGKKKKQTWAICEKPLNLVGKKRANKGFELKKENYKFRVEGVSQKLDLENLAIVLQEINNDLVKSSGYLGEISDRSKELYFKKETVGQNLYSQIKKDKHTSLRNQVFYRQDYLDEFEKIWTTQAQFHFELTAELKQEIRDVIIFYQRKLKSQKGLISFCQFESWEEDKTDEKGNIIYNKETKLPKKRIVGQRVIPKSSLLFQESKIWAILNILEFKNKETKEEKVLGEEIKLKLFERLNIFGKMSEKQVLNFVGLNEKVWKSNFTEGIEGNNTNQKLYEVYQKIAEIEGYGEDWEKKSIIEIKKELNAVFSSKGINSKILEFDANLDRNDFDKQESYQFWHLLYSAEDGDKILAEDKMLYGNSNVALKKKLHQKYGFEPNYANMLANVSFQQDYGNLSARAIKKILPFLIDGNEFSEACNLAKYNHSNSLTKEELANRILKEKLDLLPKNSLRNPVVEKILNQMINVINQIVDEYGKPDEIRIELARELKKSAKQREETTKYINEATLKNESFRKILKSEFGIQNPTRNDVIKYKLYDELKNNGHRTLFTNQYIPAEKLFSKEIDIEHIIPKAKLFDDSFSNKTLAYRSVNLEKANTLAFDFISNKYNTDLEKYKSRVESAYKSKLISKGKYKKLLLSEKDLIVDFLNRDLKDSQYIAKKAKQLLEEVFQKVTPTIGRITDKLREDWDLINVMKELNLPKYRELGLTQFEERKYGKKVEKIIDWTKRNDHRHHAMDALAVAFTTESHIQYLNNLATISHLKNTDEDYKKSKLFGIKQKITKVYKDNNGKGKRKFIVPTDNFRQDAKEQIEQILISFKAKNKVVTKNKNKTKLKGKDNYKVTEQLTPRGQLHKETIYGKLQVEVVKVEKINAKFTEEKIKTVTKPLYKEALLKRLKEFNGDSKKAFAGKNSLIKNPIYFSEGKIIPEQVKTKTYEDSYTIRKEVNPDNFKDLKSIQKVIDIGVRRILEKRLSDYNNKSKEAFSDLEKNPIWLNEEKGISIKRVLISGVSNVVSLHIKKNHFGKDILSDNNKEIKNDFVSTGNNHHVAIYIDKNGKLHDEVISFFDAVTKVNLEFPVINKELNSNIGWKFLFSLKQNEMFLFSSEEFNPKESDLFNENLNDLISKHLFRVQKFSRVEYGNKIVRDYVFRHHLETELIDKKETKDITYKVFKSLNGFDKMVKVRINHIGKIVHVGEY